MIEQYLFPLALSWGIPSETFWELTPNEFAFYTEAERIRRKTKNEELHLLGAYVNMAVGVNLANAFAKKGAKKLTYNEKPFDVVPKSPMELRQARREEMAKFKNWTNALMMKYPKKE